MKINLWIHTASDVTGLGQSMAAHSHGAPLGAAYLAGWGAGLYRGIDRLTDSWLEMGRTIVADRRRSQFCQRTYDRCLEARAKLAVRYFP